MSRAVASGSDPPTADDPDDGRQRHPERGMPQGGERRRGWRRHGHRPRCPAHPVPPAQRVRPPRVGIPPRRARWSRLSPPIARSLPRRRDSGAALSVPPEIWRLRSAIADEPSKFRRCEGGGDEPGYWRDNSLAGLGVPGIAGLWRHEGDLDLVQLAAERERSAVAGATPPSRGRSRRSARPTRSSRISNGNVGRAAPRRRRPRARPIRPCRRPAEPAPRP